MGLRRRIGESFELAALPGTTEEDRRKALHFCVVGGGPTGNFPPPWTPSFRRALLCGWWPAYSCSLTC